MDVETGDPIEWLERYYAQSEQRPAKCFRLEDENYALVAAQPDYDEEWFAGLDAEVAAAITETEQTKVLETRRFHFSCGCSKERILPTLASWKDRKEELFQGEESVTVNCPRCGAHYRVSPEELG